ncbi:MAG: tRNA-dihydrouridine synthase, partial [bacterium]
REPERIKQITRAVVGAATVPVTAKIRIGWDGAHLVAVEVARILEGEGIQAISVHGRTFEQGFSGRASWEAVAEVKRAVGVPVVLSGDVAAPEDAERAFAETGCDALMVGRGSFGRPWVFAAIRDHLAGKAYAGFSHRDVAGVALRHLDLGIEEFGEHIAVRRFRKHLLWYTKGMYGVVRLRTEMCKVITRQDVAVLLEELSEHPWQTGSGPVGSWEIDGADACSGEASETGERNG